MPNDSNEFIINIHGPLQPINGAPDPNGGYITPIDPTTGRTAGGLFTGAGVPANMQLSGAQPFTQGFTDSMEKNNDRRDMAKAGRAIAALEDEDFDEFDRLTSSLDHGFICGKGAERR